MTRALLSRAKTAVGSFLSGLLPEPDTSEMDSLIARVDELEASIGEFSEDDLDTLRDTVEELRDNMVSNRDIEGFVTEDDVEEAIDRKLRDEDLDDVPDMKEKIEDLEEHVRLVGELLEKLETYFESKGEPEMLAAVREALSK